MSLSNLDVLFLGMNFPPEISGNAPYSGSLCKELAKKGGLISVITTNPHYPEWKVRPGYGAWSSQEVIEGVNVRRLRHYIPYPPRGIRRLLSEISFGLRVAFTRWGKRDAIILVSPAMISSAIAMFRAQITHRSIPTIVWVQDLYTLGLAETGQGGKFTTWVMSSIEGWLLRRTDRVVVIHDRFAKRVQKDFDVPIEKVQVIRNWTHLETPPKVDRAITRQRHGWLPDERIILHTGNMGAKQGLENVIEAARLAQEQELNIRFVLLGDGGERTRLQELGEGLTQLEFINPLNDFDYVAALAGADCLLVNELPGVSEMAVPSKLTSYFNSGRPVLAATALDGITAGEILASGAGVVVESGNPEALLHAAHQLSVDETKSFNLGKNGQRYRKTVLSQEAAVDNFRLIFDQLIH